jgi:radical SAM superfamily enzyme YgiQ (UPF0313 family)
MSTSKTITMQNAPGDQVVRRELARLVSRFEFEDGAVLVNVPEHPRESLERQKALDRCYLAFPPQGLFYLSAMLRSLGIRSTLVDLNLVVLEEMRKQQPDVEKACREALAAALEEFKHPWVGISFMFDPVFSEFTRTCEEVRRQDPSACIIAGGVAATADPPALLREGLVDLVLSHEAEMTLAGFYGYIRNGRDQLPVNVSFLDGERTVRSTPEQPGGDVNLDIRDEYDHLPLMRYCEVGTTNNFHRMCKDNPAFVGVLFERGCRFSCSFCSSRSFFGSGVRKRRVEDVIAELETLYYRHGIRYFRWLDVDLLAGRDDIVRLLKLLAERLPDLRWDASGGLNLSYMDAELMDAMERSGCIGFNVALESGNRQILRRIKKPVTLKKFYSFAELAHGYPKMWAAVNIILGTPEETFGQMLDSLKVVLRAKLDWVSFFVFMLNKNTEFYRQYGTPEDDFAALKGEKEAPLRNFNPMRTNAFGTFGEGDVPYGYDVFELDAAAVPEQAHLTEIWFTFNHIVNFVMNPALTSDSEIVIRKCILWLEGIQRAFSENPIIDCTLYYLHDRLAEGSPDVLETLRMGADVKFRASEFWRYRDAQFGFSSFLEGKLPKLDPRLENVLAGSAPAL